MAVFDQLHPSLQHHIVNTLGWRKLRPLQEATIEPVLNGEHALLLAPTAGGKTEAASFPVVSLIAAKSLAPPSVLYIAPLKALLNNLLPRLEQYTGFVGCRSALWHGDISPTARKHILTDPPDILLTTPESLESMLISKRVDSHRFFRNVQTIVIDEVHAFASDDRGWHLLAVLERISKLAGREIQRLGLSATVGNPDELLEWLCRGTKARRGVIAPTAETITDEVDVEVDWVGSLINAAMVISKLHLGEKRLVFVDSRARAEELTALLTERDVTTFVSHGSLGRAERLRTEQAFSETQNCVIVATSTLELGIDIGDLDRVIQIDAPATVASFLQRLGRTGRRPGSTRNALFLATKDDAFRQTLGLLKLWNNGFVEPVEAPEFPAHLLAQQMMALALQEPGLGITDLKQWLGDPHVFGNHVESEAERILQFMLSENVLFSDQGRIGFGDQGEAAFGRRHFMELMSAFTSEPVFTVRSGRNDIGQVPDAALAAAQTNGRRLLLAGRHWLIEDIDWNRRVILVTPITEGGKIRFLGDSQPLGYELCQSIRAVLAGDPVDVPLSARAHKKLDEQRIGFGPSAKQGGPISVVQTDRGTQLWSFAGIRANLEIAARLHRYRLEGGMIDNFMIPIDSGTTIKDVRYAISSIPFDAQKFEPDQQIIEGLKFAQALPPKLSQSVIRRRLSDIYAMKTLIRAMPG